MADRPFESEKAESVFDHPHMTSLEGWLDAFNTVKDSYSGRDGSVKLALPSTTVAIFNRDDGNALHEAYAHIGVG